MRPGASCASSINTFRNTTCDCAVTILRNLSTAMAKSGEINVENFSVGMAVEVTYITPDAGRPTMNLIDGHDNVVLHVNPRWEEKALVLNTKKGNWGPEERPSGFDFSSGVPITIRVEAGQDNFNILVNGRILHVYKHRMPVNEVKRIIFYHGNAEGATKPAKLISFGVYY